MRTSLCLAALASLVSLPAFAEASCSGTDSKGELVAAVSVRGNFKECVTRLMQGAKTKCPSTAELRLTVTGNENGKDADVRVLRIDCGAGFSTPLPQGAIANAPDAGAAPAPALQTVAPDAGAKAAGGTRARPAKK